jgi:CRP-like cAMP-binding protein
MQIWAVTDCEILFLDFSSLFNMEGGTCPFKMRASTNLLREFAEKARFLNDKVRILAQKRLRDKLKVYLQMQKSNKDGWIELPFRRNELAEFLCVDRSALSRELSRMQQDGILSYEGKRIRIHDITFFQ